MTLLIIDNHVDVWWWILWFNCEWACFLDNANDVEMNNIIGCCPIYCGENCDCYRIIESCYMSMYHSRVEIVVVKGLNSFTSEIM